MKISLRVILLLLVLSQAAYAQRKGYVIFSGKIIDIENKIAIYEDDFYIPILYTLSLHHLYI